MSAPPVSTPKWWEYRCVSVYFAVLNSMTTEHLWGRKGLFYPVVLYEGNSGTWDRKLEVLPEAEPIEGRTAYWLAIHTLLSLFTTQDHLPRGGSTQ